MRESGREGEPLRLLLRLLRLRGPVRRPGLRESGRRLLSVGPVRRASKGAIVTWWAEDARPSSPASPGTKARQRWDQLRRDSRELDPAEPAVGSRFASGGPWAGGRLGDGSTPYGARSSSS